MNRSGIGLGKLLFAVGLALALSGPGAGCSGAGSSSGPAISPEEVVRSYLEAMKSGNYARAYDLLTPYMVSDKGKVAWVAEQTAIMNLGGVEISSFEIFPARLDGDKAVVPNLLKSKDKYINQTGADEFELYTLVRGADGGWRIEQQQLVETDGLAKWFPEGVRERR